MTSTSPFNPSGNHGFGFIGMIMLLMIVSIGVVTIYMLTLAPFATRGLTVTNTRATALRIAVNQYRINHGGATGAYPALLTALVTTDNVACVANNTLASALYQTLQGWCGPYIDQVFAEDLNAYSTDGWGTAFAFNSTTGVLSSCGADRTCGNADDITYSP